MDFKGLRRQCEARVRDLDIPIPFGVTELCSRLAASRGRRLSLLPMDVHADGPCGLWIATTTADYIFYEARTSPPHQEHIVLHEVGHMLCSHQAAPVLGDAATELLLPNLDPAMVSTVLGRTHYSVVEEQEAELIATLILGRVSRRAHPSRAEPSTPVPAESAGVVERIERSLAPPAQA